MKYFTISIALLISTITFAQAITSEKLLKNAIKFHDPNNQWKSFQGQFKVVMQTPKAEDRQSEISIDIPGQVFKLTVTQGNNTYQYIIQKDSCKILLNGQSKFTEEQAKQFRLNCERGTMFKDYYTYLYGLPMKLKDPGTIIDPQVQEKTFKGKKYLVLKATYKADVGDDTWYFYFDPKTFGMEVYQFFHDESKNDGEYILLKDIEEINGINMPKTREWYYNEGDKYLGTDVLSKLD